MTTFSRRSRFALAVVASLVALLTASVSQPTRAAGGSLLKSVDGDVASRQPLERAVRRSRVVSVDFSLLRGEGQRQMMREPAVTLELFPDLTVFAEFDRYDEGRTGTTWVGRVGGVAHSTVTLAYGGGLLTGTVVMPSGTYHIKPAPGGAPLHVVQQVDQSAMLPEADPVEVRFSQADLAAAADTPMTDTADQIDLLVVYTALAAQSAGGETAIRNLINLGVSETNTSYANGGVTHRIRLVQAVQVPYVESGDFSRNLNDLRLGAGALSGVAALRDAYGADLVKMLVHPSSPSACGIAYIQSQISAAFASSAFSVTDTSCVSPNFTFAHELGHNMGARHDWYMDSSVTPFTYAHGYVNPAIGQRFRTVMSYPNLCTALGFSCTRVLSWANPDVRYLPSCDAGRFNCGQLQYWYYPGAPMGVPQGTSTSCQPGNTASTNCDADDRRVLNASALTIANFRQRVN